MHDAVRVLFHEVAELPPTERRREYTRRRVSQTIRSEVESLLSFDETLSGHMDGVVGSAAEHMLLAGAPVEDGRCGPFRIVRLLGNGGMGAVYLAERADGELQQQVAIKFLRPDADAPMLRERFLRERQILASLNHPGIARLLDAGHSAGRPYLVMEYVDGTRIDQYAAGMDAREVVDLFLPVAEAVSHAHRNLIIHRDLKPSNILIDAGGRPKLLDFGIAKILDAPEETRTVDRMLTPEYASPEQLEGNAQTTSTDVYSLGAVLHKLLKERQAPRDLEAILRKATRQEPEARYVSVDAFVEDLRAYLEYRPVRARSGNTLYVARKFLRRYWIPAAAAFLAVAGLAGGLWMAERERAIAQRRFGQVRQLSNQLLELDGEIRSLPGSTRARNRIVSASLGYLERLAAEARPDGELALEIGAAYLKVARVQGVPTNANLGQFDEAGRSLLRAAQFVDPLAEDAGFAQRAKAMLTSAEIAHDSMILAESARQEERALELGRRASARLEAYLAMARTSRQDQATAARIFANLALAHSNLHQLDAASAYARRSVDLSRLASPGERQLSAALGVYANTARFAGDLDGALAAIRESRAIAEKLADPQHADLTLALCASLWREGLILGELHSVNMGRAREAAPLLTRAYEMAEALARKDAHDSSSRFYVSMAGRELGDILRDAEPARALAIYDHTRSRVAEIRDNSKARREEVWLLVGSAYALRRLGRPEQAGRRIDAAFALLRTLKTYPAAGVTPGDEADAALRALGDHYADTGRVAGAIGVYRELEAKIQASNPHPQTDLRHANQLSRLFAALAALHRRAGQTAEAEEMDRRRAALWRRWDRKLPGHPFVRRQFL
jgi:tRNA A-37 threonylcarbamoyl transferase component Bud32